jgi:hypothetical protein
MNSGTYNYFLNGEPTGVTETFEIKLLPDGTKFTQSIRDAKPYNTTITVKVMERENQFRRVEIRYVNKKSVHGIYSFQANQTLFIHETFTEATTSGKDYFASRRKCKCYNRYCARYSANN